ncbi:hypothetical protein [Acetonema longum]|uniref:Uncharacterized protein n=1 Tax=Acetonema longum DSM 6540 TaxID=1009370 RepID=F7NMJ3_9FIRM|nr:hypothetical protein [Acetonema longum]EGO62733.1 hypothetical protein ALO_16617 [Acetonema longum DSM 6540]
MNGNKKWFLAISMATMIGVNGVAVAAVPQYQTPEKGKAPAHWHYQRPGLEDRGDSFRQRDNRSIQDNLLKLLKMNERTFQAQIKSGKSLAAIAKKQGVSERTLKNFLVDQMEKRIDQAVKHDNISRNQAKQMKAKLPEQVKKMINRRGFDCKYTGILDNRMYEHGKTSWGNRFGK